MALHDTSGLITRQGEAVMLEGVRVTGELRGLIYDACVEQRFCNTTDDNVEVVYTFPLPFSAVLLDVSVQLGVRILTGTVVEKKQAEAGYEAALSDGHAAIMLEKNHDHSYSLNLGNLAAHESCVIALRTAQTLQFEQRGLRLLIPTVIAPRYGDAVTDGGMAPHQTVQHSLQADYPFHIDLRLYGDLAKARVHSPSHAVAVHHGSLATGDMLTVSLARHGALDRDFVLVMDQLQHDSMAVMARDAVVSDGVAVLASFCPRIVAKEPMPLAVKILVDCSGSMGGDSIDAAKRALQAIIGQLTPGDHFSLSRFGSSVEHRSRGLWSTTAPTQSAARRWIHALAADLGGTEMAAALASTFNLAQSERSDVLIVTDGEIEAIDRTITTAVKSGHRLFVVGIGSSPAESHLRRLADATGGACDFVAPGETVEPAVLRMFARLRSPRLSELALIWPDNATPEWVSPLPQSVFDGDTISVFALLRQMPTGEVCLRGSRSTDGPSEQIGRVSLSAIVDGNDTDDTLSRMTAAVRMRSVDADWPVDATSSEMAVAYKLITDQTNFLLVHERAEGCEADQMPLLHKVSQMGAAGHGGLGSVIYFSRKDSAFDSDIALDQMSAAPSRAPAMFRRVSTQRLVSQTTADYDTPAFLRKRADDGHRADPRYWSESADGGSLTPLGLCTYLALRPSHEWPTTYDRLRQIGVSACVVDWLELIIAAHGHAVLSEQTVVSVFVQLMARPETSETLTGTPRQREGIKRIHQQIKSLFVREGRNVLPACVDPQLAEKMMAELRDMTAQTWPNQIYTLDLIA